MIRTSFVSALIALLTLTLSVSSATAEKRQGPTNGAHFLNRDHTGDGTPMPVTHPHIVAEDEACQGSILFDLPAGAPFSPKYRQIRNCFFENFFFTGEIAEGINGATIKFADQTAYMGFALVTFAGEAKILAEAGLDTQRTELAIGFILDELVRLETQAEAEAYPTEDDLLGFFVRDYIKPAEDRPVNFGERGFTTVISDYSGEYRSGEQVSYNARDKEMSKDQLIHLLVGLWAVQEWAPDAYISNRQFAQQLAERFALLVLDNGFYLRRPDGEPVFRGADAFVDAGFLTQMILRTLAPDSLVRPFFSTALVLWPAEDGFVPVPLSLSHGAVVGTLLTVQSLQGVEITIPFSGTRSYTFDTKSFAYNLALLDMAFEEAIDDATFNAIAEECSDPSLGGYGHIWAKLLRAQVQDSLVEDIVISQANAWHDLAPKHSLVGDPTDNPIWFKDNRWIRCGETNAEPGWIWNGLDFLSLDVLMHMQAQNSRAEVFVAKPGGAIEIGTPALPYDTVREGVDGVVRSGKRVLRIRGGHYSETETLVIDQPMRLENDGGGVVVIDVLR